MKPYSREQLAIDNKKHRISVRLVNSLRFTPEAIDDWNQRDFLVIMNKSRTEGLFLFDDAVLQCGLAKRKPGNTGRAEPILCDFCRTWQRGSASAIVTFKKSDRHSISYLVCADLNCSAHVRDLTDASKLSRTQLHEHITPEQRIERLTARLRQIVEAINT